MDDEEMCQLALEAQKHSPGSRGRQIMLTKLIDRIVQSPWWSYSPGNKGFSSQVYEDICQEARQNLLLHICQNIDKYNPEKGWVREWVNFLMRKRFFNEAIALVIGKKQDNERRVLDVDYDNVNTEEEIPLSEQIRQYLENDPEKLLQDIRHKKHPDITFQILAIRRYTGETWKEIVADFGLRATQASTLSDFYQRTLQELAPKIKLYLQK